MSLIHTCQLCDANSFDYLAELQRHAQELAIKPAEWMPWTIARRWSGSDPLQIQRRVMINRTRPETILFGHARADAKMAGKQASRNQESDRIFGQGRQNLRRRSVVTKRMSPK